mgnify:FL=1
MWFGLITLFPEMFSAVKDYGVLGRAVSSGLLELDIWNPRDFALDRHRTVDDRPYGGGPGMLMKVQPLQDAIIAARKKAGDGAKVIYLSPQGERLNHAKVKELAGYSKLICIAGRYEGIDERLIEAEVDQEISIGDFVLSGGELASMVLIDAVARLLPGVLGHKESAQEDSFVNGLLDCPHYTRPELFSGVPVPGVLLSGNHDEIRKWRLKQALGRTWSRRPDLMKNLNLDSESTALLQEFIREVNR